MALGMRHIEPIGANSYRVRIIRNHVLHRLPGTFNTVEAATAARDAFLVELDRPKVETSDCTIRGVTAEELPDFDTAFQRAREEYQRKSLSAIKRQSQRIEFTAPQVCAIFFGDQHLGNSGSDVERIFHEAQLAASMPNTFTVLLGDLIDNFVPSKLQHLNFNSRQSVTDQYVMAERYIQLVKPAVVVEGNHEGWSQDMTGVDIMRQIVARNAPNALYDCDDCRLVVSVAGCEFPARFRHKWRGNSIYNPTHAIERAQKWDQDFLLGVGAHTHVAGVSRQFNAGGRMGLAVMVGSYKRHDTFAAELGLPKSNGSTAMAVLFDAERESMIGFDNLEKAAEYMGRVS